MLERRAVCALIEGYQRYLSPRKGFVCAHRVLHGGDSCSQYTKRVVLRDGVRAALTATRVRLQECKTAGRILQSRKHDFGGKTITKRRGRGYGGACFDTPEQCDCIDCGEMPCAVMDAGDCLSTHNCGATESCTSIDCAGLDCASLDCSGLDCGSLDCGSCNF